MDLVREVSEDDTFWNGISEDLSLEANQWKDLADSSHDSDFQPVKASRKNAIIAGLFYFMAFVMFFSELRIVSLFHCIFGTLFMFFYKIGIQAGDE